MLVPKTKRIELIRAASAGLYEGVWSPWIIAETWRVLTWRWAKQSGLVTDSWRSLSASANRMFVILDEALELSVPRPPYPPPWPELDDPYDGPVFAAAVHSGCNVVVSENVRDFPPGHSWGGIAYRTADEFLESIGWPSEA